MNLEKTIIQNLSYKIKQLWRDNYFVKSNNK